MQTHDGGSNTPVQESIPEAMQHQLPSQNVFQRIRRGVVRTLAAIADGYAEIGEDGNRGKRKKLEDEIAAIESESGCESMRSLCDVDHGGNIGSPGMLWEESSSDDPDGEMEVEGKCVYFNYGSEQEEGKKLKEEAMR